MRMVAAMAAKRLERTGERVEFAGRATQRAANVTRVKERCTATASLRFVASRAAS